MADGPRFSGNLAKEPTLANEIDKLVTEIVHFARVALQGDEKQTSAFVRRLVRKLKTIAPERAVELSMVADSAPRSVKPSLARKSPPPSVPVDGETRLSLLQLYDPVKSPIEPILPVELRNLLKRLFAERAKAAALRELGMEPTKSLLFVGPPGVGKTITAHWLATQLQQPLYTLNLASVMSSYLGRTGANIRNVLSFFQSNEGILFLDEFDAVAKKRSDDSDIGELRRLVTVILQEIDNWPSDRLLIAATNHGELLDPAVWRRFDAIVRFPMPSDALLFKKAKELLPKDVDDDLARVFAKVMSGRSFSELENEIKKIVRHAVVTDQDVSALAVSHLQSHVTALSKEELKAVALNLLKAGMSQRQVSDFTGLARDTIRIAQQKVEADG